MRLTDMVNNAFNTAKKMIEEGRELMACFMVEDKNGELHILMCPMGDNASKDAIFGGMRGFIREKEAKSYVFVTEAWTVRRDKETYKRDRRPPSECEDRIEVLMVDGHTREGEHVSMLAEIKDRKVMAPMETELDGMTGRGACLFHREEDLRNLDEAVN